MAPMAQPQSIIGMILYGIDNKMIKKLITQEKESNNIKGFTMIELLLYMVILGTMLALLSGFVFSTYQARIKNQTIAETEQQGVQMMETITQTVRNAQQINTPPAQSSGASLSVNTHAGATTPTVFDLNGSNLQVKEGTGATVSLTGSRVAVSGLNFTNVTETGGSGTVRIQFTLTHHNTSGLEEYTYAKTFYGTASVRP